MESIYKSDVIIVGSGIAGLMPQYQAGSSQITGSYGLPVDPLAAGMQGAMSVYGGLYKNAYPGTT